MQLPDSKPTLILIDIQKGHDEEDFYGGDRNNRNAEKNCSHLLNIWRKAHLPIFHIQHSSQNSDSPLFHSKPGFQIKDEVKPIDGEPIIVKRANNAFLNTNLNKLLVKKNIKTLVIVGMTTNHCISSTARMASDLGYNTIIVSDATACFDRVGITGIKYPAELIHQTTLASLKGEIAKIIDTNDLEALI